jgi:hypothetical protein
LLEITAPSGHSGSDIHLLDEDEEEEEEEAVVVL